MEIRVLGPLEVVDGGRPLPLGGRRQRAVLALLAIHAGEVLSTDRMVEEIWAGDPPPSAVRTLHAYVSRLRAVLATASGQGAGVLASREPGYRLEIEPERVDSVRFERAVLDGARALVAHDAVAAAEGLRAGLALWRGTALADFAYEPFAARESERLAERRIEALELRIDADLALARHAALVAELESSVTEHPLRERFWAQLMVALYRCGRQADALSAYGRVRRILVEELGIEPGPELRRLERLVLEQSAELAWLPAEAPTQSGPARPEHPQATAVEVERGVAIDEARTRPWHARQDPLPLVGRERQLEQFSALLTDGRAGRRGRLVVVIGEAGCGKTRLLGEFARLGQRAGAVVASGSAEQETSLPYGPFAEIVRDVINATGGSSLERVAHLQGDLAWLVPELGTPPQDSADLGLARVRLMEAVLQLLASAASADPLLLLVDDAHRMGEGALSMMRAVLDRSWPRDVLVVAACRSRTSDLRPATEDPVLELLKREEASILRVDRLTPADLRALVELLDMRETAGDRQEMATRLGEETGGIPLLVREVLATRRDEQPSDVAGDRSGLVTPLVHAVISRRTAELAEPVQRLLEVASVVGMQFDVDVLTAVTGYEADDVVELLDEALDEGLVTETGQFDRFAFDHGLIRQVVSHSISLSRQTRLHAAAAEALSAAGSHVEAARHALAATASLGTRAVVDLAIGGADAALASLEFELARQLCENTLSIVGDSASPGRRADLLLRLGRAYSFAGRPKEAEEAWRLGADLARAEGDLDRLAQIALGSNVHGRTMVPSELRWELLSEVLQGSAPQWSPQRVLVASAWLIEATSPARRLATPELMAEVTEAAARSGDSSVLAAAYQARHVMVRARRLPFDRRWSSELIEVATKLADDRWLFEGYLACLIDAVVEIDLEDSERNLEMLRQAGARLRLPRALWTCELATATFARMRGEFEIADEQAEAAARLGEHHGIADALAAYGAHGFLNAYHRGGLAALRAGLEQFAALAPQVPAWTFGAGLAAADDGDLAAARDALDRGLGVLSDGAEDEFWLASVCLASEIAAWIGADGTITERLEQLLLPNAGQIVVVGTLSGEFGPVDRCLGLVAAARGDVETAAERFASATDASRRFGARPWELRTLADWLVTERDAGRPAREWWSRLPDDLHDAGLEGTAVRLAAGS